MLKKLINIRVFFLIFKKWHCVGSWSSKLFLFCPNFPLHSFAKPSAYIRFLIHSLIWPMFIDHLLCPGNIAARLLFSFSVSPTQTWSISWAPSLGASFVPLLTHLVLVAADSHLRSPALCPPNPAPIRSWFCCSLWPSTAAAWRKLQTLPAPGHLAPSLSWPCILICNIFEHPSPMCL